MSHTIALSMRLITKQYPSGSKETFNALASTWFDFLIKVFPQSSCLNMPSNVELCRNILKNHPVDAVILSGGDDIGVFPQRDEAELYLLEWADKQRLPVLGVCRGMQLINSYFGGTLEENKKHIATRHSISFTSEYNHVFSREVNSYHGNCVTIKSIASPLIPIAYTDTQDCVEAFVHKNKNICGIMWHPEREEAFNQNDINLFKKILGKS